MSSTIIKLAYFFFFSWFCLIGPQRPIANYDMFPYVGAVLSYSSHDGDLRERSLTDVKNYVSEAQYRTFTDGSYYVNTVARDDKAFLEQIPGYRVKPLYVLLTGLLSIALSSISLASVVVSSAGFFLIGVALYLLKPKGTLEPFYLIAVVLLLFLGTPTFTLFPSVSSPDSLAIGLGLLGFWSLIRQKYSLWPMVFFSLSILARPDSVITLACLLPFIANIYLRRKVSALRVRWFALTVATPVAIYLFSTLAFPGFSLRQLIVFAFEGPFPYLSSIDTSHFWGVYKTALYKDVIALLALPRFVILLVTNIVLLVFCRHQDTAYILLAALGNILLKITLFPNFDGGFGERFFCISYFLILYSVFCTVRRLLDPIAFEDSHLTSPPKTTQE